MIFFIAGITCETLLVLYEAKTWMTLVYLCALYATYKMVEEEDAGPLPPVE